MFLYFGGVVSDVWWVCVVALRFIEKQSSTNNTLIHKHSCCSHGGEYTSLKISLSSLHVLCGPEEGWPGPKGGFVREAAGVQDSFLVVAPCMSALRAVFASSVLRWAKPALPLRSCFSWTGSRSIARAGVFGREPLGLHLCFFADVMALVRSFW